jgi:CubicO group peptidase (beta-lactamase class C family)
MEVTRRDWLGLAASAGAVAAAAPLGAQGRRKEAWTGGSGRDYGPVIERIRAFAAADLADKGLPGITLALVGPDQFAATLAVGFADLDRRVPAAPEQLFQIGSITKSLTAMALFVLADRGRLDLDARVQDLLPDHPMPPEPITLTHLLEHSSGLPNGLDNPAYILAPGGRLWTGFKPGSRYSYCNLGYGLLGAVIERASGMAYPLALETLILKPLGMVHAVPVIRTADRAAFATGHIRFRDDIPWLPKARLTPARWMEFAHAAGSVGASGADMVRYLQFVSGLARGKGAPLFSDALAERFRTPTIDSSPPGARYGNGLHTLAVEQRPCFRHTGGMHGFSSAFTLDREAGVGCYASVNVGSAGNYRPTEVTEYALPLLRAASAGRQLPAASGPKPPAPVKNAERYAGQWLSADGSELSITERGGALFVTSKGLERPLRSGGEGGFVTDHPALAPYTLVFEGNGQVLRLGGRLFGRGTAPPAQPPNPRLAPLVGNYQNPSTWSYRPSVHAIGERLFFGTEELVEAADGSWRFKSPGLASERIWFQHPIGGRAQVLNASGTLLNRVSDRTL